MVPFDSVQYGHYDDGEFCNGGVDKHVCQSIDPKQPNWGPGQRTVHALDQEVVQHVPVYNKENSEARNAERRGQDVGGCSEPTCGQLVNRENSIVYSRGFIPYGTGI